MMLYKITSTPVSFYHFVSFSQGTFIVQAVEQMLKPDIQWTKGVGDELKSWYFISYFQSV